MQPRPSAEKYYLGYVRFWPLADIPIRSAKVRFRGFSGQRISHRWHLRLWRNGFLNFLRSGAARKTRRGKQWGKQIDDVAESPTMARRMVAVATRSLRHRRAKLTSILLIVTALL
jgi:hypothetical protein